MHIASQQLSVLHQVGFRFYLKWQTMKDLTSEYPATDLHVIE